MTVFAVTAMSPGRRPEPSRSAGAAPAGPASAGLGAGVSPSFSATVDAAARTGAAVPAAVQGADPRFVHQRSESGALEPLQKFEGFVLRSFIENMMPSEDSAFFGSGTAGKMWKSMLAERIGDEMAASGGIGIADMLAEDGHPAAPVPDAPAPAADVGG